jgi:hypothetical protein
MASGAKHKVRGEVTGCLINLGDFANKSQPIITILGSYDIMISIDWNHTMR